MGIGDEIIASGHARTVHRQTGKRIVIVDQKGAPRWSALWRGLDWIVQSSNGAAGAYPVRNGPGCRPYIAYPWTGDPCRYSGWKCSENVGAIALDETERRFAAETRAALGDFVIVEPNLAGSSNPNKQWGWDRWQALVEKLPTVRFVQMGPRGTRLLDGVTHVETPMFRHAAAVLSVARGAVVPEGALHHAAAALGKCVVVLFGGTVDVQAMGYPGHINVVHEGPGSPCGKWRSCPHCAEAWASITPDHVAGRLRVSLL